MEDNADNNQNINNMQQMFNNMNLNNMNFNMYMNNMNNMNNMNMGNMGMNNMGNMNTMNMGNMGMNNMGNMNAMNMGNMGMNNMGNMNAMNMGNMDMNNMGNMNMAQMYYMMQNGMFNNFMNNNNNTNEKTINVHLIDKSIKKIKISSDSKIEDLVKKVKQECKINFFFKLMLQGKNLVNSMTIAESGLDNESNVFVIFAESRNDEKLGYVKNVNILFNINKALQCNTNGNIDFHGIAKVCLLKEISSKLDDEKIEQFDEPIACILKLLKCGRIKNVDDLKESKDLLEKYRRTNVLNFAQYIDKTIDTPKITEMINLLDSGDSSEIMEFKKHLAKMADQIEKFNKDFLMARKKSVFEFSLVSLEIADRPDVDNYMNALGNCPNKNERILYHGIDEMKIPYILKSHFKPPSINVFGQGYYFSNSLDLSCILSRDSGNKFKVPSIDEAFSIIASSVFYNDNTRKRVNNNSYSPKTNEANIAMVDGKLNPISDNNNKSKFYSREYIIGDACQILPFINMKIKRNEYCVIWRDNNFSSKDVYGDKYDKIFKKFLQERLEFINQYSKFNIYPCETTKEALALVKKKKHNKIILMSNVGSDLGGKKFVEEARKIIGNDVIALFLAYMVEHLEWIVKFKNSLFSNDAQFYEQYLECFTDDIKTTKQNVLTLKNSIEDYYSVKFNMDETFLDYPHFKDDGDYASLDF